MPTQPLLSPAEIAAAHQPLQATLDALNAMLLGREELHRMVLVGLLARGHLLLEGLPGLGKTALVKALSAILHLDAKRVQFTPDLMPGDILGAHILQDTGGGHREMVFQPGPVFCNILLADEINRASPKTQSAMLETMQERCVTLMGVTRKLPDPFCVLASQNPIELEGTYPLPEAQLDRFLFRLVVGSVNASVLERIIAERHHGDTPEPSYRMSAETLDGLFDVVNRIVLPRPVAAYIARVVAASHADAEEAPETVRTYVTYGASPRAAIAMAEASRGVALLAGRPSVGFEDVRAVAPHVLNHRLILNYKARFDKVATFKVVDDLLAAIDPAGLHLPDSVSL
jgi:MoxR-like ATPase